MSDPIDRLSAYRPTTTILEAQWGPEARALLRDQIPAEPASRGRLRFVPRRQWPAAAAIASGAAVVAALGGVVVAVASRSDDGGAVASGFVTGERRDTPRVGAHQYAYRAETGYSIKADGTAVRTGTSRDWVSPDGTDWSIRTGDGIGAPGCFRFPLPGGASFQTPTQAFFDGLPTEAGALRKYVRSHVSGSTSRDEATFVAAGDMLRYTDLLASSDLRAAYVQVLAQTGYTTLHEQDTDQLGRPAIRADFVDATNRPGETSSLYFDPQTFQLLEERHANGPQALTTGPSPANGVATSAAADPAAADPYSATPSPAWTSSGPKPDTPAELSGPAIVAVMTDEKVVDALPAEAQACTDH